MNIVLSIKPQYVKEIFKGEKLFEFRKKLCSESIDKILVYETAPVSKVVGEVEVKEKLTLPKDELWEVTKDSAGVSKEEFYDYFSGYARACAYVLGKTEMYAEPKSLAEFGLRAAPQSFAYVR